MTRTSKRFMVALMIAAPVAAADEPVCANCWDGPEMFEYGTREADRVTPDAIVAEDIGLFPDSDLLDCGKVALIKALGGADWQVTECGGRLLMFSPSGGPEGQGFFILKDDGGEYSFDEEPPQGERAKAAYLELRSLTSKQLKEFVREVRDRD